MLYPTTEATDFSFDFRVNEILRLTEKGRDPLPVFDGDPAQSRQALEEAFPKVATALDKYEYEARRREETAVAPSSRDVVEWRCETGHLMRASRQVEPRSCWTCGQPAHPLAECEELRYELDLPRLLLVAGCLAGTAGLYLALRPRRSPT